MLVVVIVCNVDRIGTLHNGHGVEPFCRCVSLKPAVLTTRMTNVIRYSIIAFVHCLARFQEEPSCEGGMVWRFRHFHPPPSVFLYNSMSTIYNCVSAELCPDVYVQDKKVN